MPRFILFIKATAESEGGKIPETEDMQAMMTFYKAMHEAGVVQSADGLHASKTGARVIFHAPSTAGAGDAKAPHVQPGPFTPAEELVAGFWILKTKDFEEAVEWAKKAPIKDEGTTIEVRRIVEFEDFKENVTEEMMSDGERLKKETAERIAREEAK